MNLSELCVRRPVMTILLTAAMVLGGLAAYNQLPVAALPRVDFPVISVTATMPGASPETMAASVASPLEREFSTIAGIDTITSSSSLGNSSITIQFALERNIDAAAADVQAAIARTARKLPSDMTDPPSYRKVNPADAPVLLLALRSATMPLSDLDEFAETVVQPKVSTLDGVAQVQIYGAQKYAVRIQIDPNALAVRGLGIDEVQTALAAANANTPIGTLSGAKQQLVLAANPQLRNAAAFRDLIVAYRNGGPVRLGDIATVLDSVENIRTASWHNGTRSIVLAVQRQPDANTVDVVDRVRSLLPTFRAQLPPSATVDVMNDRSTSIRQAVEDVQFTLGLTIGLVVLVIFLFLRRLSATLIPAVTVPISLIATAGGMHLFGFSIDNISLMALTLAVGLVVDDAIVMMENIVRYVEEGVRPFEAAIKGAREVGFTIVSITLSLVAVFIPILLMGGVVGRIFHEFAVVVTMAIASSAFVSLTLTPMMCSRILTHEPHGAKEGPIGRALEGGFDAVHRLYGATLRWSLDHKPVMGLVMLATVFGSIHLASAIPKGFFPTEDIGQISVSTEAAPDISFPAMAELQKRAAAIIKANPAVEDVTSSVAIGGNSVNTGRMFVVLKPQDERPHIVQVIQQLRRQVSGIPGMAVYMQPVQNLRVGGRMSKSQYQYTIQGLDLPELYSWSAKLERALHGIPFLQDVTSDLQLNSAQAYVHIDREKAATLGISVDKVRSTLYSAFGQRQVSTIYTPSNDYEVLIELAPKYQQDASALSRIYVRNASGTLVPLDAFASVRRTAGPLTVNHQGQLPAVTLSFNLTPGASLGEAVDAIRQAERDMVLPASITTGFAGTAQVFQDAQAGQGLLLLAAVTVIYIVLGVLYESFIHPLTILSGLPSATIGALATLMAFGQELSVIAIIGILMLIGIVKKNAIMMIDFAIEARRNGLSPREAIEQACLLRFRPIMMTTMAAIMGTLPIAVAHGAAAELRQPLGLAVVGGLCVSQLLTLYITPVLYLYMEDASHRVSRMVRGRGAVVEAEGAHPAE